MNKKRKDENSNLIKIDDLFVGVRTEDVAVVLECYEQYETFGKEQHIIQIDAKKYLFKTNDDNSNLVLVTDTLIEKEEQSNHDLTKLPKRGDFRLENYQTSNSFWHGCDYKEEYFSYFIPFRELLNSVPDCALPLFGTDKNRDTINLNGAVRLIKVLNRSRKERKIELTDDRERNIDLLLNEGIVTEKTLKANEELFHKSQPQKKKTLK